MLRRVLLSLTVVSAGCADESLSQLSAGIAADPASVTLDTPVQNTGEHVVRLKSVGAAALEIESIEIVPAGDDLAVRIEEALPAKVAPGQSVEAVVVHVPRDATLDGAVLRVISNDPTDAVLDVPITHAWRGAARVAAVPDADTADAEADTPGGVRTTVASVAFGVAALGQRKLDQLDVVNIGEGTRPLVITSIGLDAPVTGLDVDVQPAPSGLALPALAAASASNTTRHVRVSIAWTPTTAGEVLQADLQIVSDDPNTPTLSIPITGETAAGDPPVMRLAPAAGLDVGRVGVGDTGEAAFEIHNDGNGPLFVQPLTISTNPQSVFALATAPTALEIPAGGHRSITVRLTPLAAGPVSGTITIDSNDPASTSLAYPINGSGSDDSPCMPAMPDPGEPANDQCNAAVDLGMLDLPPGNQTHMQSFGGSMIEVDQDHDWSVLRVSVANGCTGVGYSFNANVQLPAGEQGRICMRVGDCGATPRCGDAGAGARFLSVLGGTLCRNHNNAVPVYIHVEHTGGERSCQPYTMQFSAR